MKHTTLAISLLLPSLVHCGLPAVPSGWSLKWADDFKGTGQPSRDNWIYDIGHSYPGGAANWGTGEIGYHTDSPNNVFVDGNGNLVLKAIKDNNGGWTTARIETKIPNFAPPPNGILAVEGRLKLPKVAQPQGYWPAFWMLGEHFRGIYTNWPDCGEIDIMENVNGVNTEYGTLHCDKSPGGECYETTGRGGNVGGGGVSLQDGFRVYRMELDVSTSPQAIRWYLDGKQFHTVTQSDLSARVWNGLVSHGYFIILNLAMGGGWPGSPRSDTTSGGEFLIDYVAVYTKGGNGSGSLPPSATTTKTATSTQAASGRCASLLIRWWT
ncbi:Laminin subunit alpha-1 [Rhizophlyctis rosea]|uniref:Laminin subunit alpha-1 n=1 Tax=Rhizophlyctis rosea TaxID=64517 RepID=A0AAD5S8M0_9FUNG|nr:Laminin subunit alpha-1 [Rhizophlyctis rosea]